MKKTLVLLLLCVLIATQEASTLTKSSLGNERNIGTCAKFTSDKQSCLECVSHYHLFQGQCYIDIHGCSQYVFGNICRKCQNGFILVNNECCDKHCMSRIFKNYEATSQQSELSEEQKIERRITEGYEKTVESLTIFRYQFIKFALQSTSNQVLHGYVRYFIKILANDKPYRCIADFQIDSKKVFILQFRLESQMSSIKQNILSQQDVVSNDQARVALQYTSGKFGLRTYGSSLERVSVTNYKYGSEFKLIYIGSENAMIINVVVATGGNKKQPAYSPWSQQRKDVQAIRTFVQKSMSVVKMKNVADLQIIKQKVSETNHIKSSQVQMKTIEKVRQNVYKYTFVNQQTKQVFEEISRIDPKTKTVQIVEHKQVISKDVKNMVLPESPQKKIIPRQQITETIQVKQAIKYLEEVQPSLATKQITNAAVQTIGENKKITLIQKKNDQNSRVVILQNERTNEFKLIDESPIVVTPPKQTIYTTSTEGKQVVITTDVEKFKKMDTQVEKVISTIESKLTSVNTSNIQSFEKTEGNLVNTYQVVVKQENIQLPKQQVTVIQNTQTKEVKIIDVKEIATPAVIRPVIKQRTEISESQFQSTQIKSIVSELQKTTKQLKQTEVTVKKVEVEQNKFANQYTLVVQTKTGETLTVKANKPHDQKVPQIINVRPVLTNETQKSETSSTYISKVTVDETTGVKTVTSTKKEDIQTSFVVKVLSEVKMTKSQAKVEEIQSVVKKQYEKTVVQTVVIKQDEKFVQVTVEQNKQTGVVKKISEQVVHIEVRKQQVAMPVFTTTQISQTTFNQIVKVNQVLRNVTQAVVLVNKKYEESIPIKTQVQEISNIQVVTLVYEDKVTKQHDRIVIKHDELTNKTVIVEQTTLPSVIEKVVFEKDTSVQGQTTIVSNKIEQIRKEDKHITQVFEQVYEKFPIMKENSVNFVVVSSQLTNTYQITAVEQKTKQVVTVSVSFNKQTQKMTVVDIQETQRSDLIVPRPAPRPLIVVQPEEFSKTQIKNVVSFVEKVVNVQNVKEIKQVKGTYSTNYEVTTQTSSGIQTVTVVVNKANSSDITLIDIKSETSTKVEQTQSTSYTTTSIDSLSIKEVTSNNQTVISSNKYLRTISQEAVRRQPLLKNQVILCFSEDTFEQTVYVSYIAQVGPKRVLVSGFVKVKTSTVQFVQLPTNELRESHIKQCSRRNQEITTLSQENIHTLERVSKQISSLVSYINSQFSPESINKLLVQKFINTVKYVITVTIRKTTRRIVLIYQIKTTTYSVVESQVTIQLIKPVILEQKTESDGTLVTISNSFEQVMTVDKKVEKFVQVLSQQIQVKTSEIVNVVSKQHNNTNQYTITVKNKETTSEITAIFQKDEETVIVTEVKEQTQPLIAPIVKPKVVVSKQQYTSSTIQKVIEQVNRDTKVTNITTQSIVDIVVTKGTTTNTYEIITQTKTGRETIVVSESVKGELIVIDYKPSYIPRPLPLPEPSKTEITVNTISGVETQVTNDTKVIKQTKSVQNVVSKLIQEKSYSKNVEVVSAVTKTFDTKVQTSLVIKPEDNTQQNTVIIAFYDKQTEQVTIVAEKTIDVVEQQVVNVQTEIITTVYSTSVIQKTITQNTVLRKSIQKVRELHSEVVQKTIPTQVIMEKIGQKVVSTISYEGKHVSTVVYNQRTEQVEEITYQVAPMQVKELIYETEKTIEGNTIITTNSVQKITEINQNFEKIITEIKQTIPSIQTEKIQGIRITKSDIENSAQKIVIVFQSQKQNQQQQIVVIDEPTRQKPVIIDVQTILQQQVVYKSETVKQVKLSQQQIKTENVQQIIQTNIQQLPIKEVKQIIEVHQVKTGYSKTLEIKVEDTKGQKFVITTSQVGQNKVTITDYVKVSDKKSTELFTITSTNPKNGIISTYTNDIKVMSDEKTFTKVIDVLEKQKSLTKTGYTVDSQTVSRFQRSVEHHVRFVNKETNEGVDYRVIVDSRTGQVSINEQQKFTIKGQTLTMPAQKQYLEIPKSQLSEAMKKYSFIQSSLDVLRKADYTYESKIPDLTQVKQYKSISSTSTSGSSAVQVVMTFPVTIGGVSRKTRVVFLGQQKQTNKGFVMKIIDITTLPQLIPSTETKVVLDEFNRKITETNDIKTLQKTNVEYTKVIEQVTKQISTISSSEVNSVLIRELKNVNEYTIITKKGSQVLETKVQINKKTQQIYISDFKTQSTKTQVQKLPIKDIQSIIFEVPKDKLISGEYQTLKQQIIKSRNLPSDVQITSIKIEQNPKVDTFVIRVVHSLTVQGTVTAIKNPTDNKYTIISYKPDQYAQPQPIRTINSTTQIRFDSVTGSQIVVTNDVKVIKQTESIQNVMKKIVEEKKVSKVSEVVSAVTKTSQSTIQTTLVIQEQSKTNEQKVIVTIVDKKQPKKVEVISQETIYYTGLLQQRKNVTDIVQQVVVTQAMYQSVIQKDTYLQSIVEQVTQKYTQVINVTPTRVTIQQVGNKTITEFSYEDKKITVISNEKKEVIRTFEQKISTEIVSGTVETRTTTEGTKTINATSVQIMEKVDSNFKVVVNQFISQVQINDVKTVVSQEKAFGIVYTVISQKSEQQQLQQTTYYYNKETKKVVVMQTQQISVINVKPAQKPEPSKQIHESKWQTKQVKSVIQEITNVVHQEKVLKVEELKSTSTIKFYEVTVETSKGQQVVKVTVDKFTSQVKVIEQTQVTQQKQTVQKQSSHTFVKVDSTTGVKTTITTDKTVIQNDVITTKIQQAVVRNITELRNAEIISTTTKKYDQVIEQRIIFHSEKATTQVITTIDTKTSQVKIVDSQRISISEVYQKVSNTESQIKISSVMYDQVVVNNVVLKKAVDYVYSTLTRFKLVKPSNVNIEQVTSKVTKFTFIFTVREQDFRVVITYLSEKDTFSLVEQPSEIEQIKSIVLDTKTTTQGKTTIFTNDVESLVSVDKSFTKVISNLQKQITISQKDIASIQSTETSVGNTYTIITKTETQQNQISVVFNEKTNEVKIINIQSSDPVPPFVPGIIHPQEGDTSQSIPRFIPGVITPEEDKEPKPSDQVPPFIPGVIHPSRIVPREQYSSPQIMYIIQRLSQQSKVQRFVVSDISKVARSTTLYGVNYAFEIVTKFGTTTLVCSVTSSERKVTVISYRPAKIQKTQQTTSYEAASTTQFTVDVVTGSQIQTTNDVKVIKESQVIQNIVKELVKEQTISKNSTVVSTVTKTEVDNIRTTLVVKTSETESKVIVTLTDKKTNEVTVIAQKEVTKEQIHQVDVSKLVSQTVISSTLYQEVIKKDYHLQQTIKQIKTNHPQIKETKPQKVVIQRVGEKTITQVNYKDVSYTVVTDMQTGKTQQVTSTTLVKKQERKAVFLEEKVTEEGYKVVTSNKIEQIQKVVPTVRTVISEATKVVNFKTEQIKSITASVQQKQFTVVTVDQNEKVKQIKFTYDSQRQKVVKVLDVQQFSEPYVPTKPKEIVYETVKVSQQTQIVKAIEQVNKTSSVIKSDVRQIVKVQKSVTNFVEQYKAQVKTSTSEEATIIFEVNPKTKQTVVVDIIKYEPSKEERKVVVVEQKIDSVTQTRQTVFTDVQTYKHDETYSKVKQYLGSEITKGYNISSVVKENYGQNQELTILLKSQDKSPQQIQLNINSFNNQVTVLQNKTIVHEDSQTTILVRDQPKPSELKLNPVDQQKFDILSKLQNVKQDEQFKTVTEIKTLQKNDLFKKADEYLKTQYQSVLEQSNVVHVAAKQTLDSEQYKVYYINTEKNDKEVYEAKISINPITQSFEIQDFSKVGTTQPQKSKLNIDADIAYGYQPLQNFSNDKNIKFVVEYAKKNYPTLSNAVIQSVQVLQLCNQRFNYKIFFKNGLEVLKYIIYFEQSFQRVIVLAGRQFSLGGQKYSELSDEQLQGEGYFKNFNQYLKQKHSQVAQSRVQKVYREDSGVKYSYSAMYNSNGKTYHVQGSVNKDNMAMELNFFNQVIEIPIVNQKNQIQEQQSYSHSEHFAILKINDLAHNSNFERVHRQILSKEGGFLQNAQLIGAKQRSDLFLIRYVCFFFLKQDYYKIEVEIDSVTKKVTILSELAKINIETGFAVQNMNGESQQVIGWAQKNNPDLKSGVIVEISSKKEIFGVIYKLIFKLHTKYVTMLVYVAGGESKLMSQSQSTSLESGPSVRPLPRPNSQQVVLNKA